ncbi:MAG: hypothetical protein QF637_06905, partial [Acidimicrobiales bacterium]|nr:hypothetical protein [Acidimicrobiales bacterium]
GGRGFESLTAHCSDQRKLVLLVVCRAADARQLLASWPLSSFLFVGSVATLILRVSAELR